MLTVLQSVHDRLIREVADDYTRQGYAVLIEPSGDQLPDFLQGFRPDMIVHTPDGSLVVEVKGAAHQRDADYWKRMTEAVKSHPGWRFHFVMDNRREEELASSIQPVLSEEEVTSRLQAGRQLAEQGLLDSALVVVWATLEALLRQMSRTAGVQPSNQGSGPLITALLTQSSLDRSDYETLMRILAARNQAAHGFRVSDLNPELLAQAQSLAQRLLRQQNGQK